MYCCTSSEAICCKYSTQEVFRQAKCQVNQSTEHQYKCKVKEMSHESQKYAAKDVYFIFSCKMFI